MATWTFITTNKGLALQAKLALGETLVFTRVVSGAGIVSVARLREQTAVTDIKQTLSMENAKINDRTLNIRCLLTNKNLSKEYDLSQVGFYATDPDYGEILYAIAQIDETREIPTESMAPGFGIEFNFALENENADNVTITLDPDSYLSTVAANEMMNDLHNEINNEVKDELTNYLTYENGPTITE